MHSAISPQQTHTSACSRTRVLFNNWGKLWKPVTVFKSAVMGVLFKVLKVSGQSLAEVALWVNAETERVRAGGFPSPNSSPQRRKKGGARGNRTHTHTLMQRGSNGSVCASQYPPRRTSYKFSRPLLSKRHTQLFSYLAIFKDPLIKRCVKIKIVVK